MRVEDVLKQEFVKDNTKIKILKEGEIKCNNYWFFDDVLHYFDCEIISFTYDTYMNTVSIFLL